MCPHGMAHWHHLVNTIELSICSGDVVLCQITLTTLFTVKHTGMGDAVMICPYNNLSYDLCQKSRLYHHTFSLAPNSDENQMGSFSVGR